MRRSTLLAAAAGGVLLIAAPGVAAAQTAFPTSNPNAAEWALINLTPKTVADANGGKGVIVGLYDGLTDCRDTDLSGRCTNTIFSTGRYNQYDNHGTHTAGTIAGSRYGVATSATIANYAVFDDRGYVATGSNLSNAWVNAASRGASIASMSFGCSGLALCFSAGEVRAMGSTTLAGTLFVKAAGNDGVNLANESISVTAAEGQAALGRLILVGSVNVAGTISTFSNRPGEGCLRVGGSTGCTTATQWKYRFIVAPGESIYATLPNNRYGYMSGTSMATPIVAATAALLEARWPTLRSRPETVASILFTSATDLGTPGVDAIYGNGLLNVGRAFQNYGTTSITSPTGQSVTVSGGTVTTGSGFGKTSAALAGITAWDAYGRDYRLDELSNFSVRRNALSMFGVESSPIVDMGRPSEWTSAFFSPVRTPSASASFGPRPGSAQAALSFDRSLRASVDAPVGPGLAQLRLTGETGARNDFAADPSLRPMSFFASSDLLNQSALASLSLPFAGGRLVVFGAQTLGGHVGPSPFEGQLVQPYLRNLEGEETFTLNHSPREQAGFGVSYWMQPDPGTLIGVSVSALDQRHAFYDLASDIESFDNHGRVVNVGLAATRAYGDWDLFGAGEVTAIRAPRTDGPIQFSDATLVSGELGVRRSNLFAQGPVSDNLTLTLRALPQAVSGAMTLNYLAPSEDGLDTLVVNTRTPLAELTGRTVRMETSYRIHAGDRWSLGVAAGADLSRGGEFQLMTQMRAAY